MNPPTPGRIYGSIAALALLTVFVVEPQRGLPDKICGVLSFWQSNCVVGVQPLYRWALLYCLFSGYLISRIVDRKPDARWWLSLVSTIIATFVLAVPLLIGFGLYYH